MDQPKFAIQKRFLGRVATPAAPPRMPSTPAPAREPQRNPTYQPPVNPILEQQVFYGVCIHGFVISRKSTDQEATIKAQIKEFASQGLFSFPAEENDFSYSIRDALTTDNRNFGALVKITPTQGTITHTEATGIEEQSERGIPFTRTFMITYLTLDIFEGLLANKFFQYAIARGLEGPSEEITIGANIIAGNVNLITPGAFVIGTKLDVFPELNSKFGYFHPIGGLICGPPLSQPALNGVHDFLQASSFPTVRILNQLRFEFFTTPKQFRSAGPPAMNLVTGPAIFKLENIPSSLSEEEVTNAILQDTGASITNINLLYCVAKGRADQIVIIHTDDPPTQGHFTFPILDSLSGRKTRTSMASCTEGIARIQTLQTKMAKFFKSTSWKNTPLLVAVHPSFVTPTNHLRRSPTAAWTGPSPILGKHVDDKAVHTPSAWTENQTPTEKTLAGHSAHPGSPLSRSTRDTHSTNNKLETDTTTPIVHTMDRPPQPLQRRVASAGGKGSGVDLRTIGGQEPRANSTLTLQNRNPYNLLSDSHNHQASTHLHRVDTSSLAANEHSREGSQLVPRGSNHLVPGGNQHNALVINKMMEDHSLILELLKNQQQHQHETDKQMIQHRHQTENNQQQTNQILAQHSAAIAQLATTVSMHFSIPQLIPQHETQEPRSTTSAQPGSPILSPVKRKHQETHCISTPHLATKPLDSHTTPFGFKSTGEQEASPSSAPLKRFPPGGKHQEFSDGECYESMGDDGIMVMTPAHNSGHGLSLEEISDPGHPNLPSSTIQEGHPPRSDPSPLARQYTGTDSEISSGFPGVGVSLPPTEEGTANREQEHTYQQHHNIAEGEPTTTPLLEAEGDTLEQMEDYIEDINITQALLGLPEVVLPPSPSDSSSAIKLSNIGTTFYNSPNLVVSTQPDEPMQETCNPWKLMVKHSLEHRAIDSSGKPTIDIGMGLFTTSDAIPAGQTIALLQMFETLDANSFAERNQNGDTEFTFQAKHGIYHDGKEGRKHGDFVTAANSSFNVIHLPSGTKAPTNAKIVYNSVKQRIGITAIAPIPPMSQIFVRYSNSYRIKFFTEQASATNFTTHQLSPYLGDDTQTIFERLKRITSSIQLLQLSIKFINSNSPNHHIIHSIQEAIHHNNVKELVRDGLLTFELRCSFFSIKKPIAVNATGFCFYDACYYHHCSANNIEWQPNYNIRKPLLLTYIIEQGELAKRRLDWLQETEAYEHVNRTLSAALRTASQGKDSIPQEHYANGIMIQIWEPEIPKAIWTVNAEYYHLQECTGALKSEVHYCNLEMVFCKPFQILCQDNHFTPLPLGVQARMSLRPKVLETLTSLLAEQLGSNRSVKVNV